MDLPEDLVLEILLRVGVADAATLFRCGTACKRWRALVGEHSFVRRRQRAVAAALGMYDAEWALSKVMQRLDVQPGQDRLLIRKKTVQLGPIPRVFPELAQLADNVFGVGEEELAVTILNPESRVEQVVYLRYVYSNLSYRIRGTGWRQFVTRSRISKGDRLDIYVCRRGAGERCLLVFNRKRAQRWSDPCLISRAA